MHACERAYIHTHIHAYTRLRFALPALLASTLHCLACLPPTISHTRSAQGLLWQGFLSVGLLRTLIQACFCVKGAPHPAPQHGHWQQYCRLRTLLRSLHRSDDCTFAQRRGEETDLCPGKSVFRFLTFGLAPIAHRKCSFLAAYTPLNHAFDRSSIRQYNLLPAARLEH